MALSKDGRTLYPFVVGPLVGDDPLVRHVYEFDVSESPFRPGDFGLGKLFKFPYQTVEAVLPLSGNELALVNDTNFGSTGRNPNLPDYSDFIIVKVPGIRG
jgi:hypothetical protein